MYSESHAGKFFGFTLAINVVVRQLFVSTRVTQDINIIPRLYQIPYEIAQIRSLPFYIRETRLP